MTTGLRQDFSRLDRSISLGNVLVVYTAAFLLVDYLRRFVVDPAVTTERPLAPLLEINAGLLLALAAVSALTRNMPNVALGARDLALLSASTIFLIPPVTNLPYVGLTAAGIYLVLTRRDNEPLLKIAAIWFAISCYAVWGKLLFKIVFKPFVEAEAVAIGFLSKLCGIELDQSGILLTRPDGWSIFIAEPCSSFHNISLSLVVWLCLLTLANESPRKNIPSVLLCFAATIALNAARILAMAQSEASYNFWHEGNGAVIFSSVALVAISAITLTYPARRA